MIKIYIICLKNYVKLHADLLANANKLQWVALKEYICENV